MSLTPRVLLLGAGLAAFGLFVLPGTAQACGDCTCYDIDGNGECEDWEVVCVSSLTLVSENLARLSIDNYTTETMEAGACSVWLSPDAPGTGDRGPIRAIERVSMIEEETGEPIAGYRFEPHPRPSSDFAFLAAEHGLMPYGMGHLGTSFFTSVHQPVEGGISTSLVFELEIRDGATLEQVARQLRSHGVLGTGSANPDGSLDVGHGHHMILPLARLDMAVIHPGETAERPLPRTPDAPRQ